MRAVRFFAPRPKAPGRFRICVVASYVTPAKPAAVICVSIAEAIRSRVVKPVTEKVLLSLPSPMTISSVQPVQLASAVIAVAVALAQYVSSAPSGFAPFASNLASAELSAKTTHALMLFTLGDVAGNSTNQGPYAMAYLPFLRKICESTLLGGN